MMLENGYKDGMSATDMVSSAKTMQRGREMKAARDAEYARDLQAKKQIVDAYNMGGMDAVDKLMNTPAGRYFANEVSKGLAADRAESANQAALGRFNDVPVVEGIGAINVEPYKEYDKSAPAFTQTR